MPRTVVMGASPNPARASFVAVKKLVRQGETVVALGRRRGTIETDDGRKVTILDEWPDAASFRPVDTLTLYLNPRVQKAYYDYILAMQPRRIIFNPGTENDELAQLAQARGIEVVTACTLVMLSLGRYAHSD